MDTLESVLSIAEDWNELIRKELDPWEELYITAVRDMVTLYYRYDQPEPARQQWEHIRYKAHPDSLNSSSITQLLFVIREYYRHGDRDFALNRLKNMLSELNTLIPAWGPVYFSLAGAAAGFCRETGEENLADSLYHYFKEPATGPDPEFSYYDSQKLIEFYTERENHAAVIFLNETTLDMMKANRSPEDEKLFSAFYAVADNYEKAGIDSLVEKHLITHAEMTRKYDDNNPMRGYLHLASFYARKGRFDKSEPLYREFIKSSGNINLSGDSFADYHLKNTIKSLARQYLYAGLYEPALHLFEQEYRLRNEEPERFSKKIRSSVTGEMGLCHYYLGQIHKADSLLSKALSLDPENIAAINNLALVYKKQKEYEKARALFQKVEKRLLESTTPSRYNLAIVRFNIGDLEKSKGNLREAEKLMLEAFADQQDLPPFDRTYLHSLNDLAEYYALTRDYPKAYEYYQELFAIRLQQIHHYFEVLAQVEKEQFYSNIRDEFEIFNFFALHYFPQFPEITGSMYNYQLSTKAILLRASQKLRKNILESGDSVLIRKFGQWENLKQDLARTYQQNRTGKEVDSLETSIYELEKFLTTSYSRFEQKTRSAYHWTDVRDQLQPGEAAIEMIRIRNYDFQESTTDRDSIIYAALIVKSTTIDHPELVVLPNGKEMEGKWLNYYRNGIQYQIRDTLSYFHFWDPVKRILDDTKRVYFSPDGVYNLINLNTLFNPDGKKYLLDEIEIQQVTNTRDLLARNAVNERQKSIVKRLAVLFGNPAFHDESEELFASSGESIPDYRVSRVRGADLVPLPGTLAEVNSISGFLSDLDWMFEMYTGKKASEGQLKRVRNPRILHVATHGFFMGSGPVDQPEKALLQSGLMMAGAAVSTDENSDVLKQVQRGEDGILTAYEAMHLDLDNTDLVVLSACETALGHVTNGEGVYGLQRSFLVSGAHSVLMSLWKVNDETTKELMSGFYTNWLQSGKKLEAFRQAQQSLKSKYNSPYYWGAFVMVGF